jgi:carboxypeptidase Taq
MTENLKMFKKRCAKLARLRQVAGLLAWDQQTYMPSGAAAARAEQSAELAGLIHEMATSDEMGSLLSGAETDVSGMDADSDDVRMLKEARRAYDRVIKLPTEFVAERSKHQTLAMGIWQSARASSDFSMFAPALEKTIELTRQYAEYQGYVEHIYDPLLDPFEPGATQASIAAMFSDLTPHLVRLTAAIKSSAQVDDALLHGDFPIEKQRELTLSIVKAIGYDLSRGRQDEAAHPFCSGFSRDDVRITTRFDNGFLQQALYASLHEAGHAMYEQGIPARYSGTPLARGASLGIHESQSRLWENQVGRSRQFAQFVFPTLQAAYPCLGSSSSEAYYRAINKVEPSFIRVEADEVTYNLHTALRFELECALVSGALDVNDLPDAWNAKMSAYLGICPPDDAQGVLQDVHWSIGLIGYFPTYTIGNLVSAQLWNTATQAIPNIERLIETGEFAPLLDWLRTNVHEYGSKYLPHELIQKTTGSPLMASHYAHYLTTKYGEIYGL